MLVPDKPKRVLDLPIYKDTFLLINLTILVSLQAPKVVLETFVKYILEREAKLLLLILKANRDKINRKKYLDSFLVILEETIAFFEIFISSSKIALENIVRFHTLLDLLGKQSCGWSKTGL